MATYIKESSSAADAARLNLLEEKVQNLAPAEGTPSDIVEALNRLYDMTMRGGMHTDGDVTSDLADGFFWMRQQSISEASKKSLVSVTYGNTDTLNRVKDIPFLHQVLGVDAAWNFTKSAPRPGWRFCRRKHMGTHVHLRRHEGLRSVRHRRDRRTRRADDALQRSRVSLARYVWYILHSRP
ncbi:hypothetical protein [Rhizobium leguminosarum]|uniref:hypothetical protein n=1 Tax=Rhizobium leguminosarum TaxID=384 RepID=UPI00144277A9|nr:hypothetical protein [Rhizobium leguminosarum]MBY5755885.1 hypothetical protein [Rhizobium leguminosarum]MBY5775187.1 hypothetical protein [Rhizobium leguminosarum]MBY5780821.1 hypothetical protein [Rhizobium leguminosarum]MBY5796299.1 hypothetical protein [Rhizobium leguminosarum]MBY5827356.1 hypothetical protein [Rhizobium leguminosarum]